MICPDCGTPMTTDNKLVKLVIDWYEKKVVEHVCPFCGTVRWREPNKKVFIFR